MAHSLELKARRESTTTHVPDFARRVATAVARATRTDGAKATLNRSLAALRRENPHVFAELERWLGTPRIREEFIRRGFAPVWNLWTPAARRLHQGEKATQALRMGKFLPDERVARPVKLRPRPIRTFSPTHDAALLAEYFHRVKGMPSEKATDRAIELVQSLKKQPDRSGVLRWRKKVRAGEPVAAHAQIQKRIEAQHDEMLREQATAIARKYRFDLAGLAKSTDGG